MRSLRSSITREKLVSKVLSPRELLPVASVGGAARTVVGFSVLLICSSTFAALPTTRTPAEPASGVTIPNDGGREAENGVAVNKDDSGMTDESFGHAAALGNLGELELSRLAQERSRNLRVKLLADRVLKDRVAIDTTLQAVARKRNMKLPRKLDVEHQSVVSALKLQPEESFDTAYVMQVRESNVRAISLFEQAKNNMSLSREMREMAAAGLKILLASQQQTLIIPVPVAPAKPIVPETSIDPA